jgi:hypothetical protein
MLLVSPSRGDAHRPARRGSRAASPKRPPRGARRSTRAPSDLFDEVRPLYEAGPEPSIVQVPTMHFLMSDGHGDPSCGGEFRDAMAALYPVAFSLRYAERSKGVVYGSTPVEALWWTDEKGRLDPSRSRETWQWTAMLAIPRVVSWDDVDLARRSVEERHPVPGLDRIHLGSLTEGTAVQVLHRGPYATEGPTVLWLQRFAEKEGLRPIGKHHEVYLNDPRRTAPDRVRTILRQPVRPA